MAKRESQSKKTTTRKAAAAASELTDGAVMAVLETAQPATAATNIDAETRRRLVAAEAYYLAERRGFAAGGELSDWVAAERAVDSRLGHMQVA
ncbi:MAG: DUF2934 domain-containing protein [Steroidobacteraceae bacterium]|jgi:hypothetical protein